MKKFITLLTVLSTAFILSTNSAEAQKSKKDYTYKSGQPNYTLKIFSHYSKGQPVYKYYRQNVSSKRNNYSNSAYRYRNSYRSSKYYHRRSSYGTSRSRRNGYSKGYRSRSYRY